MYFYSIQELVRMWFGMFRSYLTLFPIMKIDNFFTAQESSVITILGCGEIIIRCATRTFTVFLRLKDVLFAPDIPVNVISVSQLCVDNCVSVVFINSAAIFYRSELIDPHISDSLPRTSVDDISSQHISCKSENVLPNDAKRRSEYIYTLNFSKPFFTVPKTRDNLYSFTLSSYACSFQNICLNLSPIYVLNDNIPQGTCQAVLLRDTRSSMNLAQLRAQEERHIGDIRQYGKLERVLIATLFIEPELGNQKRVRHQTQFQI